ncbi:MAG: HD domain-containing protein [Ketobacter sp.]|nr:HD domain-containing protein [Ketobacter sp.]MEC8810897.1 HD domain-containing phosphohydrolase [Pseudomonadota bacterium]
MSGEKHADPWQGLAEAETVADKLRFMHGVMKDHMPHITRIAVALYDPDTDYLRTFVYSSLEDSPLTHYQAKLADCLSLQEIAASGEPRVVNDLSVFNRHGDEHQHTKAIYDAGLRSSYTLPMVWEGHFLGFVFFNGDAPEVFSERVLTELDVIAHMITLLIFNERTNVRVLLATIKSALDLTHSRDPETGGHLERMSRYSQLIAKNIAELKGLDDQYVEHILLFAPLHDLGKLAIPDSILLKDGPLDAEEREIMRTHSEQGRSLIDKLLKNYGLNGVTHVDMLRNIALHHHEAWDGTGYPDRLVGNAIPLEARIVAVADVFDALTSRRPYKEAWSNSEAFAKLKEMAGEKLDAECVAALINDKAQIEEIQRVFKENPYG